MVTKIVRNAGTTEKTWLYDIRLLSTDIKPVDGIPNSSTCIEIDTGDKFLFDADSATWVEITSSTILINADGIYY